MLDLVKGETERIDSRFLETACEALQIYIADQEFFDADTAYRKARWSRNLAERSAEGQKSSASILTLKVAIESEERAQKFLRAFSTARV